MVHIVFVVVVPKNIHYRKHCIDYDHLQRRSRIAMDIQVYLLVSLQIIQLIFLRNISRSLVSIQNTYGLFFLDNQHSNDRHRNQKHVQCVRKANRLDIVRVSLYRWCIENIHRKLLDVDIRKHLPVDNVLESLEDRDLKLFFREKIYHSVL